MARNPISQNNNPTRSPASVKNMLLLHRRIGMIVHSCVEGWMDVTLSSILLVRPLRVPDRRSDNRSRHLISLCNIISAPPQFKLLMRKSIETRAFILEEGCDR